MFSAYMQEANLKTVNIFQFILLMFLFLARCMHRKYRL